MVRPMQIIHASDQTFSLIPLAIGLFVSATLLVALCAKHARQFPKRHASKAKDPNTPPKLSPKQLVATISHKAMMVNKPPPQQPDSAIRGNDSNKDESSVWQKAILMGEKCQPPEFPGVIYYDYCGNRISEMPKSPRASSMTPLRSFNFPDRKIETSMR